VSLLDDDALRAVLDHERDHALRRDPLRLAAGRVLAASLFFVPGLRRLARQQVALAELSADESAAGSAPGRASALARAMLAFADPDAPGQPVGFDSGRVDHLLGEAPPWRFPAVLCATAAVVIGALAAAGVLAGQVAIGAATLAPPFLSARPCVVVLAAIPAAGAITAWRLATRRR
jgi:beta-lactamase regulating signal transducer with metallopeptidase domain